MFNRANSASTDSSGKYTIYCRQCGYITKSKTLPDMCTNCGNIENGEGFHFSGDAALVETSTVVRNITVISSIQKRRRQKRNK